MKLRNDSKIIQFKPFTRLKLFQCGKINKIFDNSLLICNRISKDLNKLSSFSNSTINETRTEEINDYKNNIGKFTLKKLKIIKNKKEFIKYNKKIKLNKKKVLFSLSNKNKEENDKFILNNNSVSKNTSLPNLKQFYKKIIFNEKSISNSNRKKLINLNSIKKKILNKSTNNFFHKNSESLTNSKYYNNSNSFERNNINNNKENNFSLIKDNKYKTYYNLKTFITQQKSERKIRNYNFKNNSKKKENKILINKNLFKSLSNKSLTNFINIWTSLYDEHSKRHNKGNESLESGRQNYYKIKNLLQKFDINQSIEKEIDHLVNEDIEPDKIRKAMKIFNQSFKEKVKTNKDITKNVMITKTNADIINYSEYFCKMNNSYFYKHNKSFKQTYPILSKKAREDLLNIDYRKIVYQSHKNIIEGNAVDIRRLIKSCSTSMSRIKKICKQTIY